jgi:negative regulator of flagellin synthesis FlgM
MHVKDVLGALKGYEKPRVEKPSEKAGESRGRGSAPRSDSVRISDEARLYNRALRAAQDSPDVRQAKVNSIRELVETGEYVVDSRKTAAKIVEEDLDLII